MPKYLFFILKLKAVLTEFIKVVVGRLRPNFIDVCQPDRLIFELCFSNNSSNKTHLVPEVDFRCLNDDISEIEESRKSFPSGHASISFYSMLFLILFIHHSWKLKRSFLGLLPRFVQFILFFLALYATITRSVDNKHHVGDIIAGICLGTIISCLFFFFLTDSYKQNVLTRRLKNNQYQTCDNFSYKENNIGFSTNIIGTNFRCLTNKENTSRINLNKFQKKKPLKDNQIEDENICILDELPDAPFVNNGNIILNNQDRVSPGIRITRMRLIFE